MKFLSDGMSPCKKNIQFTCWSRLQSTSRNFKNAINIVVHRGCCVQLCEYWLQGLGAGLWAALPDVCILISSCLVFIKFIKFQRQFWCFHWPHGRCFLSCRITRRIAIFAALPQYIIASGLCQWDSLYLHCLTSYWIGYACILNHVRSSLLSCNLLYCSFDAPVYAKIQSPSIFSFPCTDWIFSDHGGFSSQMLAFPRQTDRGLHGVWNAAKNIISGFKLSWCDFEQGV